MTPDGIGAAATARHALLQAIPAGGLAVVIGATGGIGQALCEQLRTDARFSRMLALSRNPSDSCGIAIDITEEASVQAAAAAVAADMAAFNLPLRLVFVATGFLHGHGHQPEKALRQLDAAHLQHAFAVNVIGPALLMKHFLPLLAPQGKSAFAALSARVGSIGDNQLGGWYSYRACKAALNQMLHTAAIELKRTRPHAVCVALHPGTVATGLSSPFTKTGLDVQTPAQSAQRLLAVLDDLPAEASGGFFDHMGRVVAW
jgi:NAD(P)-dependent dehydrogenase (short-subunit alcohol dehydrogenase family)